MANVQLVAGGAQGGSFQIQGAAGVHRRAQSRKVEDRVAAVVGDVDHILAAADDEGTATVGGGCVTFRGAGAVADEVQRASAESQVVVGQTAGSAGGSGGIVEGQGSRSIHQNAAGAAEVQRGTGEDSGRLTEGHRVGADCCDCSARSNARASDGFTHTNTCIASDIQGGGSDGEGTRLRGGGADAEEAVGTAERRGAATQGGAQGVERIAGDVQSSTA